MEEKNKNKFKPIAVVGISAIFPGSVNVTGFWKNIMEKADLFEEIPPDYWFIEDYYDPDPFAPGKTYCKRGAFIPEIDFDPIEFSIPPANVEHTDTSQLLGLIVAKKVLEDAA
ncbi:MAG: beta-ketoacyl synthase N-terminal-like domain-containing protein, partial [Deferribacterota bacterium]|nr:beta-ketoacyl synthase N-terminal-like domain-containing protein [Deferribacterota bacterium]